MGRRRLYVRPPGIANRVWFPVRDGTNRRGPGKIPWPVTVLSLLGRPAGLILVARQLAPGMMPVMPVAAVAPVGMIPRQPAA
jgi:hypothetical protein